MARISQLPIVAPPTGDEFVPLVQDDQTRRARVSDLTEAASIRAEIAASFAEEFSGIAYTDIAAGEAATAEGKFFRVPIPDTDPVEYKRYQRTDAGSIEAAGLATTIALGSPDGALFIRTKRNEVDAKVRDLRDILGDRAVSLTDFEGVYPDGSGDSSYAFDAAKNAIAQRGGGHLLVPGKFLLGEQVFAQENAIIRGHSAADEIIIKSGTLGIHVQSDWVHFRDLKIRSEGSQTDGQGTSGVLYSEGPGNSTGHILNSGLRIQDFSGFGMEVRNTLDLQIICMFVRDCMTGFRWRREGTGPADFSTTANLQMCYGISCDVAFDLLRVRHTLMTHMICEWNRVGILADLSDFGLKYGYFENNLEKGVDSINSAVLPENCHHNGPADAIFRSYPDGVIAAKDRYYRELYKGDFIGKRFGVLSEYATDPKFIQAHGTTNTLGLRFGTSTMAMRRPGENLFSPNTWEGEGNGNGNGSEFLGWNPELGAFEIAGNHTGARGLRNPVTVVQGQTYVMDWRSRNDAGAPLTTAKVGGDTVQNGVPFTASASGTVIAKLFGVQSGVHANRVSAISLAKVDVEDSTLIADLQYRLSRAFRERGLQPVAAPPASTAGFAPAELLPNANVQVLGPAGEQYVLEGWRPIGGIWVESRIPTGT